MYCAVSCTGIPHVLLMTHLLIRVCDVVEMGSCDCKHRQLVTSDTNCMRDTMLSVSFVVCLKVWLHVNPQQAPKTLLLYNLIGK